MAFQDGTLIRVLEDHEDTAGLDKVDDLLCIECNNWFPNPTRGEDSHKRVLTGELVTVTGLKGSGTIKTIPTGVKFPFHYDTYEVEAAKVLAKQSARFIADLFEFAHHRDITLALRVKEKGRDATWVYRLDKKRLKKSVTK